jgi:gamma-glutamyl hercynylcysteine S-oxide synthase
MTVHPYVTNHQYRQFDPRHAKDDTLPVAGVTALEADTYCVWAGGRLPTDEELEGQLCLIWEWTSTEKDGLRVMRGGSWLFNPRNVRASIRYWVEPPKRDDVIGFRCIPKGEELL